MSPQTYEEEPQVSDYRRSVSSYDSNADIDHELTLSTPTILGLFFALAMVCACFFGLGYAMGHKSAPAPQVFSTTPAPATGAAKPVPGSTAAAETPLADASATTDATSANTQTATVPLTSSAASSSPSAAPLSGAPAASTAAQAPAGAAAPPPTAAPAATGTFVVQVAAVSSQDVANILVSTLEKKGYAVAVRHEPQDQLLHVQIGPFNNRKDADAMRQRVLADGFNAIVK
ncbi:MAG TPA: SPOR domain-containing protein [Acidobacteriaceae bacterium]|nr:SPOR domain-containing protein [Acidobacteriaceae bacterium]